MQDGAEVYFKIKKQTPLRKLMDAYCQRQGISANSIRFLYDGQRIQAERTPKEVIIFSTSYHFVTFLPFSLIIVYYYFLNILA